MQIPIYQDAQSSCKSTVLDVNLLDMQRLRGR